MKKEEIEIYLAFAVEGFELLDEIEQQIVGLDDLVGIPGSQIPSDVCEGIFRVVHSLKGSAGFLNLETINRLCHSVESQLELFRQQGCQATAENVDNLCKFVDVLRTLFATVQKTYSDKGHEPLVDHFLMSFKKASQASSPGNQSKKGSGAKKKKASPPKENSKRPTPSADLSNFITPEMRQSFIDESDEILEAIEELLLTLEGSPQNQEAVAKLFRRFHSFKGNAGFFGYQDAEELAHKTENLLESLKADASLINPSIITFLLKIKDALKSCVADIAQNGKGDIPKLKELIRTLQDISPDEEGPAEGLPHQMTGERNPFQILIVEDEPLQAEILAKILTAQGYLTMISPNGDAALKIFQSEIVDLCISDIFMPNMNGKALCKKINQLYPLTPVIISSGKATSDMVGQFLTLNVECYLEKPYNEANVVKKVKQALASGQKKKNLFEQTAYASDSAATQNQLKNFIRVDMQKLDKLMDLVGELLIAKEMVINNPDLNSIPLRDNFDRSAEHLHRISSELQDISMNVRMIPVQPQFRKMARLIHDLSQKFDKRIKLTLKGEDTEIDKFVLDQISDPLVHLLRNAADHGIESTQDRVLRKKDPVGHVTLSATQKNNEIWIGVKDDGRGLDEDKLRAKGEQMGLIPPGRKDLTRMEILQLVFHPGFSTAAKVTDISGRGVGMDVVKKNIEKLGGRIDIHSQLGHYAEFIVRIPMTLALIKGMLVRVGGRLYTIDINTIRESLKIQEGAVTRTPDGQELIRVRDEIFPAYKLKDLHGIDTPVQNLEQGIVMVLELAGKTVCLLVDEIVSQIETVIKPLSGYLGNLKGVSGCNILGNGDISLILDLEKLLTQSSLLNSKSQEQMPYAPVEKQYQS